MVVHNQIYISLYFKIHNFIIFTCVSSFATTNQCVHFKHDYRVHDTGIASLLLYPEDESGDSTQPEDEDSEAGETDEQDAEADPPLHDGELPERRAAPPARPNLAPHSMQWAIRSVVTFSKGYLFYNCYYQSLRHSGGLYVPRCLMPL